MNDHRGGEEMIRVKANGRGLTDIGYLGENEHRVVWFYESAALMKMYPDATVTLLHQRKGDTAAYPVAPQYISTDKGFVEWTVQSGDVAVAGEGKCELVFTENGIVAKTLIYGTRVSASLDGSGEPPEPWESWVQEVQESASRAESAVTDARQAANEAKGYRDQASELVGSIKDYTELEVDAILDSVFD